jgi:UDP-N-acetylglucosamine 4,6-dehydratase
VDVVIHAAALKQVPTAEYNPLEVIKTNVLGASNVIDAAIDCGVERVVALSTDKAVNPINLYGATKLCADKLFVAAGVYTGTRATRFSVVRYGNVMGSRGSVIPLFLRQRPTGVLSITDPNMTRFWITLDRGVEAVIQALQLMGGGEIFVPKVPSIRITDLATAVAPECRQEIVGIRAGEKLHEMLLAEEDAHRTFEMDHLYVVQPESALFERQPAALPGAWPLPRSFRYSSDTNSWWLTTRDLQEMLLQGEGAAAYAAAVE